MYLRHHDDDVENPTIKMALLLLMVDPDQQKKKEVVFSLFRAALRTGDPQTVTDFMARHYYCLGSSCGHDDGICERIVLEEAMMMPGEPTTTSSSSSMQQQQMIFQHFFRELGGRFMVLVMREIDFRAPVLCCKGQRVSKGRKNKPQSK